MKVSTGQSLHHRCGSGPFPALGILAPMFEPVNEGQLEPTSIPKLPFRNVGYPTITRRASPPHSHTKIVCSLQPLGCCPSSNKRTRLIAAICAALNGDGDVK